MQTPQYVGSSAARMIAGLALFLATLVGGVWFLTSSPGTEAPPRPSTKRNSKTLDQAPQVGTADHGAFFYRSIGGGAIDQADLPKLDPKLSYTLEIKLAKTRAEAEALIDQLAQTGVQAYYTPLSRNGQVVYRVRRGMFTSHHEAMQASVALKEQHKVATRVVKLQ